MKPKSPRASAVPASPREGNRSPGLPRGGRAQSGQYQTVSLTAWHNLQREEAIAQLQSDPKSGLSREEVQERQLRYGPNELEEKAGRHAGSILIDQFTNIMLLMLIAVAIVSAALDFRAGHFPKDAIAIAVIVILNGLLGYLQESRAEKALAALKQLSPPRVRVLRGGKLTDIEGNRLVPGDIMLVEAGVQIAADGRLLETSNLQIRESALTGEAEAIIKQADGVLAEDTTLGDRINLVYQGTEVLQGRGKVLVTRTGMGTELGQIAAMLQTVEAEPTPLQQRMGQLGNVLVFSSLAIVAMVVVGGVLRSGWSAFEKLLEVSLSMAVAVVPEGLPAVITVTLAIGTQRMVRRQALIRKLPAVETLGSVTHICSDKTGTLTQNKMVAQAIRTFDHDLRVSGTGYNPDGEYILTSAPHGIGITETTSTPQFLAEGAKVAAEVTAEVAAEVINRPEVQLLLLNGILCNNSKLEQEAQGNWQILGDPTEGALLPLAAKAGFWQAPWRQRLPRRAELPFSSERQRMAVVCEVCDRPQTLLQEGRYVLFLKGSPEQLIQRSQWIQTGATCQPLTPHERDQIRSQNEELASQGLRVLGFAYRPLNSIPTEGIDKSQEDHLIWLGLVGILDAPRPEVQKAVARCQQAGIRPIMITGDQPLTAQAIAQALGISDPHDPILEGRDLEQLSPEELQAQVQTVNVYARVAPKHKLRIVQALQSQGHCVAMTGDGINDAPALKQADIGIAMGITGTDVSQEASDMVLLDDNFATIVAATEEGRVVYGNIRRFIKYILGSNIGEVLTIAASPLLGLGGSPLTPLQILWMNLVTDGLPALALAVEPAQPNVMQRPPFNPQESIFSRGLGWYILRIGLVFSIVTIAMMSWAFSYSHSTGLDTGLDPERWKTMVFTTLCLAQMGHAIAVRSSNRMTSEMDPLSNPYVLLSVGGTAILQLLLIYVSPLQRFFGTHPLSGPEFLVCLGFSSLTFIWVELEKLVLRTMGKSLSE